ncbi:MAG: ATP-binding cassette domain-containing protein [Pseudomonadota bacterium]
MIAVSALAPLAQGSIGIWSEIGTSQVVAITVVSVVLAMVSAACSLWLASRSDSQCGMRLVTDRIEAALTSNADASASSTRAAIGEIILSFGRGTSVTRLLALAAHGLTLVLGGAVLLCLRPLDFWSTALLLLVVAILVAHAGVFLRRLRLLHLGPSTALGSRARFFRLWRQRSWPSTIADVDPINEGSGDQSRDDDLIGSWPAIAIASIAVIQIALDPPTGSSGGVEAALILALAACLVGCGVLAFGNALSGLSGDLLAFGEEPQDSGRMRQPKIPPSGLRDSSVQLSGAALCHPSRRQPVLDGINLRIEPGTVVGIAGSPGSGKTALLKVILGLAGLDQGTLSFDGVGADAIDHRLRQQHVAGILQGERPLALTLMNNIRVFGGADEKSAFGSAAVVGLGIEPRTLPQGLSTMAGDRGAHLSTSEQQRLGLACALASDARVLVVDDVTSTLSTERMGAIFERVREDKRTLILVSSDPATLSRADVTYVIENGRIARREP